MMKTIINFKLDRFQLSAGLNLEKLNINLSGINKLNLNRGLKLNRVAQILQIRLYLINIVEDIFDFLCLKVYISDNSYKFSCSLNVQIALI